MSLQFKQRLTRLSDFKQNAEGMIEYLNHCKTGISNHLSEICKLEDALQDAITRIQACDEKNEQLNEILNEPTDDLEILQKKDTTSEAINEIEIQWMGLDYMDQLETQGIEDHLAQMFESFASNIQDVIQKTQEQVG